MNLFYWVKISVFGNWTERMKNRVDKEYYEAKYRRGVYWMREVSPYYLRLAILFDYLEYRADRNLNKKPAK